MLRLSRHFKILTAAAALSVLFACNGVDSQLSGYEGSWGGSPGSSQPVMPGSASLAEAIHVQNQNTPHLMTIEGVVGTGSSVDAKGGPVVVVFATRAGVAGIPDKVGSVPVVVEVTGRVEALQAKAPVKTVTVSAPVCVAPNRAGRFARPVPIGVSTGHVKVTAGTIGARVKDKKGNLFLLSNNHVFANTGNAAVGDNVLQAGPFDGGANPGDAVATLKTWIPLFYCTSSLCSGNKMDAALAATTAAKSGNATPCDGYGAPASAVASPAAKLKVKKYGRTTGLTSGEISAVNVTVDVAYTATQIARFTGQVYIATPNFNGPGDSGSLIVTQEGNKPVALVFAGTSTSTFATPIAEVLKQLDVTIDGI